MMRTWYIGSRLYTLIDAFYLGICLKSSFPEMKHKNLSERKPNMGTYGNELVSFKRASVTESGANTFTQETISLPVDIAKNLVFLIWQIEWHCSNAQDTMVQDDQIACQITRTSQTSIVGIDNTSVIAQFKQQVQVLTSGGAIARYPVIQTFDPPLPIAKEEIYLAIASTGDASANGVKVRIHYTLREMKDSDFVKSLLRDQ